MAPDEEKYADSKPIPRLTWIILNGRGKPPTWAGLERRTQAATQERTRAAAGKEPAAAPPGTDGNRGGDGGGGGARGAAAREAKLAAKAGLRNLKKEKMAEIKAAQKDFDRHHGSGSSVGRVLRFVRRGPNLDLDPDPKPGPDQDPGPETRPCGA